MGEGGKVAVARASDVHRWRIPSTRRRSSAVRIAHIFYLDPITSVMFCSIQRNISAVEKLADSLT